MPHLSDPPGAEANLGRMATVVSRPSWELRARSLATARPAVTVGIGVLVAVSLLVRTRELGVGYWIDEGISVGIADRPLSAIPHALRLDGSPPLYYVVLSLWIHVFGRSEVATHALSLLFALLSVPACWWAARAAFGERTAWIAAVLAALNPFLTQYGQETRMYAVVALLGVPATACFLRAYAERDGTNPHDRLPWVAGFAVCLSALIYTHNWSLFFAAACAVTWAALTLLAPPEERRGMVRDGLLGFGGAALLYLPWLPIMLDQAAHTGAPWSVKPGLKDLLGVPGVLLGNAAQVVILVTGGGGLIALLGHTGRRYTPEGRAAVVLAALFAITMTLAWTASQASPAWANRYFAIGLPPLLLLAAAGLARTGRLGLVGLALTAVLSLNDHPPAEKSNVRAVAHNIFPSLRAGDLVVATQPEAVPVLYQYLPKGVRFATLTGRVADTGVTDWRDGVQRLRAATPERNLKPLLDELPPGRRLVLVEPIVYSLARWSAPWTELIRLRSVEWNQYLSNDRRFVVSAVQPASFRPPRAHPMRATVRLKTP